MDQFLISTKQLYNTTQVVADNNQADPFASIGERSIYDRVMELNDLYISEDSEDEQRSISDRVSNIKLITGRQDRKFRLSDFIPTPNRQKVDNKRKDECKADDDTPIDTYKSSSSSNKSSSSAKWRNLNLKIDNNLKQTNELRIKGNNRFMEKHKSDLSNMREDADDTLQYSQEIDHTAFAESLKRPQTATNKPSSFSLN